MIKVESLRVESLANIFEISALVEMSRRGSTESGGGYLDTHAEGYRFIGVSPESKNAPPKTCMQSSGTTPLASVQQYRIYVCIPLDL